MGGAVAIIFFICLCCFGCGAGFYYFCLKGKHFTVNGVEYNKPPEPEEPKPDQTVTTTTMVAQPGTMVPQPMMPGMVYQDPMMM